MEEEYTLTPRGYFRGYAEQEGRVFQMGSGVQINAEHLNVKDFLDKASYLGLSSYSPVSISSIDPLTLGIHRSEATQAGALPEYVARNIDTKLRERITDIRTHGGAVLLVGDSTAGKSRSAFEALRATSPDGKIWAPADGRDLVRNLRTIIEAQDGCFVWLDDLERYVGPEGLDPAALAVIRQFKIRIIATMRAEQYRRLSPETDDRSGIRDDHQHTALGARVLEQLETLIIPRIWGEEEIARAREVTDSRIVDAVAHSNLFGVAEYLAAGPRLYQMWSLSGGPSGNPRGAALVAAAIDFARAGVTGPIPLSTLLELHEPYLARAGGDLLRPEAVEEALEWATRRRYGITSLLLPIKSGSHYRVFDYLPDALARSTGALPILKDTWNSALKYAGPAELSFHVGMAAVQHKEWDVAEKAWQADLEKHPITARLNLGRVYRKLNKTNKAKQVWREASDLGSIDASIYLGSEYEKEGRLGKAVDLYRIGAAKGDAHAIRHLAYALPDDKQAIPWWLRIVEPDDSGQVACNLAYSYHRIGDYESSKKWWKASADRGDDMGMANYGLSLISDGESEEGLQWIKRAADKGNTKAMINWADHLASTGEVDAAIRLLEHAVKLGEPAAYNLLGLLRMEAGDYPGAEEYWRKGHEASEPRSSFNLGLLFQKTDRLADAQDAYRLASAAGSTRAAYNYALILAEYGDPDEAEIQFRYALALATPSDILSFGHTLSDRGLYERAMVWLDLALLKGNSGAGCLAGQILLAFGHIEDGERLLRIALSGGHEHAGPVLTKLLVRTGRGAAAAKVIRAATSNSVGARKTPRSGDRKRKKRGRR
ncbi:tetratricopeptide repeat protein [Streptomyces sp. NPDC003631]